MPLILPLTKGHNLFGGKGVPMRGGLLYYGIVVKKTAVFVLGILS